MKSLPLLSKWNEKKKKFTTLIKKKKKKKKNKKNTFKSIENIEVSIQILTHF